MRKKNGPEPEDAPSGGKVLLKGKDASFAHARVVCASGNEYEADGNGKVQVAPVDVADCVRSGWQVAE